MDTTASGIAARTEADPRTEIDRLVALIESNGVTPPVVLSPGRVMTDTARMTIEASLSRLLDYLIDDLEVDNLDEALEILEPIREMGVTVELPLEEVDFSWTFTMSGTLRVDLPRTADRDEVARSLEESLGEHVDPSIESCCAFVDGEYYHAREIGYSEVTNTEVTEE